MYSQCPQCRAIFKVSEPHLGAPHGLVRCGHCSAVFHAVTNEVKGRSLSEKAPVDSKRDTAQLSDEGVSIPNTESEGKLSSEAGTPESPATDPHDEAEREIESPLPGLSPAETQSLDEYDDIASLVTEEILIEAPPVLRDAFRDDSNEDFWDEPGRSGSGAMTGTPLTTGQSEAARDATASHNVAGAEEALADTDRARARQTATGEKTDSDTHRRTRRTSPYRRKDIKLVELPQPKPFKTASLSLLSVFLVLLLLWQVKTFLLDDLAQVPVLRPYLERICRPLGCTLPPRLNFAQIDLVGTSIDINPEVPGALQITASLINRAHFPQPYPLLRVTLTDREGRIVGRRTYLPSEYQQGDKPQLLPTKETRDVSIDLAQPAENAVGYEVELVAPSQGNGG